MSINVLEEAVKTLDANTGGSQWNTHNGEDKSMPEHRHGCCAFCGSFGFLSRATDENGKKGYLCKKCEKFSRRMSYRSSSGPNVSQTRVKRTYDLSDGDLPNVGLISGLSKPARLWIEWSETSKYSGDTISSKEVFEDLRWWVYIAVAEQVETNRQDNPKELFARLWVLVEKTIESCKRGKKRFTNAELSRFVKVDPSSFGAKGRWGRILSIIESVISEWESELYK
ncbi:MAG: hypothetical protein K6L81_01845 [Agarilytica sp.]